MAVDEKKIGEIIDRYEKTDESLLAILQDFQSEFNYIPETGIKKLSQKFDVAESRLYSMGTFYQALSLVPKGKNAVKICTGTACHLKGANLMLEAAERDLKLKRGCTSDDLEFSIETVNCVGACAMAPVVVINKDYHGHITPAKISDIIKKYK